METARVSVYHIITLDCRHVLEFQAPAPVVGEILWCARCRGERIVCSAPPQYSIRCKTCSYSRKHGAAKISAETAAVKHRMSKPGHVVKMFNGGKLVRTFEDRYQTVIPLTSDSDQIPF